MTERMAIIPVLVCGLLLAGVNARAQQPQDPKQTEDNRRIGLTLGYPASGSSSGVVGLIWEKSDRLAFRPEFSLSARFAGESVSSGATDSWALGAALTVVCYVSRSESLSTYVGPRFSYSWASSGGGGTNSRNAAYGAGVNGGVQYRLTKKISVYGEVGLGYLFTRSAYTGTPFGQTITSHNINSRSSLGLNLYL